MQAAQWNGKMTIKQLPAFEAAHSCAQSKNSLMFT